MSDNCFGFDILQRSSSSRARLGLLKTPHGDVETPNFIFCATKAAIKGLSPQDMRDAGTQIILSNTYHLMLQPGADVVASHGGLQKFTGWRGPMLTDSGGFQIFSLGHGSVASEIKGRRQSLRPKTLLRVTEDGALFKSYLDGKLHHLTPEESIRVQQKLGADLIVVLDECTPFHVDKSYTSESMHMSHRWAVRCLKEFSHTNDGSQRLYGIVQGGVYGDLRSEAAQFISEQDFFGHAIGGSLGANKHQMHDVVAITMSMLKESRPVHLLGIGGVSDIFNGVEQGIDTFDCVHPTRLARHGGALVPASYWSKNDGIASEHINLRNGKYKLDNSPIDYDCECKTCKTFSRGYLHHLLKAKELLAHTAITLHNVFFMNLMMKEIRLAIKNDTLSAAKAKWVLSPTS
jgi:queuine tRNA-ribosyltransferase